MIVLATIARLYLDTGMLMHIYIIDKQSLRKIVIHAAVPSKFHHNSPPLSRPLPPSLPPSPLLPSFSLSQFQCVYLTPAHMVCFSKCLR